MLSYNRRIADIYRFVFEKLDGERELGFFKKT